MLYYQYFNKSSIFPQYQGLWYEIQKFPTAAEKGGKCGSAEYKLEGDIVKVKNSHVIDGTQAVIEGTAKFADDAKNAAKLIVSLFFGGEFVIMSRQRRPNIIFGTWLHFTVVSIPYRKGCKLSAATRKQFLIKTQIVFRKKFYWFKIIIISALLLIGRYYQEIGLCTTLFYITVI